MATPEDVALALTQYRPMLVGLLRRMLRDEDLIDDILGDAVVKALRACSSFRGTCKISSWLYTIVHREALIYLRTKRSRDRRMIRAADDISDYRSITDGQEPADRAVLKGEAVAALMQLRPKLRDTMVLYYIEDRQVPEIVALLGLQEGSVKSNLNRGRAELRKSLLERRCDGIL